MLLTVNAELPVLLIVIVAFAVEPTWTLPNARLPLTPMMRVVDTEEPYLNIPPPFVPTYKVEGFLGSITRALSLTVRFDRPVL